jgi:hypothetical protein
MEEIQHCDDCKKKCESRVDGAICSIKGESQKLSEIYKTRDPVLLTQMFARVVESEIGRYDKARELEDIGGEEIKEVVDDLGRKRTITSERKIDSSITRLASSIVSSVKTLNDIANPKKAAPLFQQNNQINFGTNVIADDIRSLDEEEKNKVLKFIEAKTNEEHN